MQAPPSPPYYNKSSDADLEIGVTKTKATHNDRLCPVAGLWPMSCRLTQYQAGNSRILGLPYASRQCRNTPFQDFEMQTVFHRAVALRLIRFAYWLW